MKKVLPVALLVLLLVGFRVLGAMWPMAMPGFQPLAALFFCAAACLGARWLWVPALAWLLSYPLTNLILGYGIDWQILLALLGFAIALALGWRLRGSGALTILGGSAFAALAFYVVTNTGAWLLLPDYPKTWSGFLQAQWTGAPHHVLPTWVFLKNGLLANLLFTGLFLLALGRTASEPEEELAPVRIRS